MSLIDPITATAARTLFDSGALLVDVRSDSGRSAAGTVAGAVVVAKSDVASFAETQAPDREIVVFCGSSDGSGPFVDYLASHGFSAVSHVDGGFGALKSTGVAVEDPTEQPG
jgi:rhodanese-related sulfurtransferase